MGGIHVCVHVIVWPTGSAQRHRIFTRHSDRVTCTVQVIISLEGQVVL